MKKTIADSVSEKIKKGEIMMRSRFSIWTEKLKLDGSIVLLLTLLTFIAGFVFYWINSNNDLLFGGYGQYGLSSFFQSFPYIFLIGFIALFIFLIFIFRKFDFSYKKPFFFILLFIIIGILALGWISIKQPMSQQIYHQEGRFFRMGMMNNSNAVTGTVVEINKNKISIQNVDNNIIIINTDTTTHFPFGQPKVGDQIRSVGSWNSDIFTAIGVRIFDETNPSTLGPGIMRGQGRDRKLNR
jgi:hypothetical protein